MKIYVATSWRNKEQPLVVQELRNAGHEVYDFRKPNDVDCGFHWSDIDPNWQQWTPDEFKKALGHPIAIDGFKNDHEAIQWAEACVLVLPCGRSAHLEAGEFIGAGKDLVILLADGEPELMYKGATHIACSMMEALEALESISKK